MDNKVKKTKVFKATDILMTWRFPSTIDPDKIFATIMMGNGELVCNCKSWKTSGKCNHTKGIKAKANSMFDDVVATEINIREAKNKKVLEIPTGFRRFKREL